MNPQPAQLDDVDLSVRDVGLPPVPLQPEAGPEPQRLDAFVGQRHVVDAVGVAIKASRMDDTRFPHSLFVGPPGLGKSNLAQIIAKELGVTLLETLAQSLTEPQDLAGLLLEAEHRQIIFIDESDEMEPGQQTLLYRALAEGKLFLPKSRNSVGPRCLPLEAFTLIMASNHESRLARALVERFKLLCRFDFYSADEIHRLLQDRLKAQTWDCEPAVLPMIAAISRGVPRTGIRLLESCRRVARSEATATITTEHFQMMCRVEGLDSMGLDRTERAYLQILHDQGGPVRLNMIADRLGLPVRTVSGVLETFLIRQGLISRADDGRQLSPLGFRYLQGETTPIPSR